MNIGDRVVYPMHGAGEVVGIEETEVGGVLNSYYVLALPMGSLKLMLPVDKAGEVGLREIIAPEKVNEVIEVLKQDPDPVQGSWNKRFHNNLERLKTGDIMEVATIARNLSKQNAKKKISGGERRLLDLSRQILISELVFACDKTPEEVTEMIDELIGSVS